MRTLTLSLALCILGTAATTPAQQADVDALHEEAQQAVESGQWKEAAAAFRKIVTASPDDARAWHMLGFSLHSLGELDQALEAHLKAASFEDTAGVGTYNVACVYALKGDKDKAFEWLEKAQAAGFSDAGQLDRDSDMDNLRKDPRFAEIHAKFKKGGVKPRGVQAFTSSSPRKSCRVLFWGGSGSAGQIEVQYGQPAWNDKLADALESGKFDDKRWRLGQNFWTTLDTNLDLEIGGVKVPAGYYSRTLERKEGGAPVLALLDPADVRQRKLDAYQAHETEGGIEVPMKMEESEKVAEKLEIALKLKSGSKSDGTLSIHFGPYRASAPVLIAME